MKSRRVEILVAAVLLFVSASPVMAVVEFNDGGVWDIDYQINDDVWVDYESPGLGTTLNILDGATIPHPYHVKGWEDSIINILGGSMYRLSAYDSSQVSISGGTRSRTYSYDSSQVTVFDGSMFYLYAYDSSQVVVYGGSITTGRGGGLLAFDSSQVVVSGGSMERLRTFGSSQAVVSGGSIGGISTSDSSQVDVFGGSVRIVEAGGTSQVDVSGGLIGLQLVACNDAILTIHGSDFAVDGTPAGYTELYSIFGGDFRREPNRQLTGILLSGDPINNRFFHIGNNGKIVLVPEPATIFLLGLGGLTLLRRRKLVLS